MEILRTDFSVSAGMTTFFYENLASHSQLVFLQDSFWCQHQLDSEIQRIWQWKSCMSWNDKPLTRITEQGRFIPFLCRTAWRGALTARHQFSPGGLQIAAYIG